MMVLDRWTTIRRTSALAPRGVHASDTPNKYYKKILEILRTVYYNELIRVRTSGSTSAGSGVRGGGLRTLHSKQSPDSRPHESGVAQKRARG
jgi:hypothetical protein